MCGVSAQFVCHLYRTLSPMVEQAQFVCHLYRTLSPMVEQAQHPLSVIYTGHCHQWWNRHNTLCLLPVQDIVTNGGTGTTPFVCYLYRTLSPMVEQAQHLLSVTCTGHCHQWWNRHNTLCHLYRTLSPMVKQAQHPLYVTCTGHCHQWWNRHNTLCMSHIAG